jgi:hypothetical protein
MPHYQPVGREGGRVVPPKARFPGQPEPAAINDKRKDELDWKPAIEPFRPGLVLMPTSDLRRSPILRP